MYEGNYTTGSRDVFYLQYVVESHVDIYIGIHGAWPASLPGLGDGPPLTGLPCRPPIGGFYFSRAQFLDKHI
jgi:hypothetical protein